MREEEAGKNAFLDRLDWTDPGDQTVGPVDGTLCQELLELLGYNGRKEADGHGVHYALKLYYTGEYDWSASDWVRPRTAAVMKVETYPDGRASDVDEYKYILDTREELTYSVAAAAAIADTALEDMPEGLEGSEKLMSTIRKSFALVHQFLQERQQASELSKHLQQEVSGEVRHELEAVARGVQANVDRITQEVLELLADAGEPYNIVVDAARRIREHRAQNAQRAAKEAADTAARKVIARVTTTSIRRGEANKVTGPGQEL